MIETVASALEHRWPKSPLWSAIMPGARNLYEFNAVVFQGWIDGSDVTSGL